MGKRKKEKVYLLTRQQIMKKYHISRKLIMDCFPKPEIMKVRGRGGSWWTMEGWLEETVEKAVLHPEIQKQIRERAEKELRDRQLSEITELYAAFSPESYVERA